jgi:DNA-binding protein WhiA
MSTSQAIKTALCTRKIASNQSKFLCLYGILTALRECNTNSITFTTANEVVSKLFCRLTNELSGAKTTVKAFGKGNTTLFCASIDDESDRKKLLALFLHEQHNLIINRDLIDNVLIGDFFAGIFLSCGNLTEPEKGYHLEMVLPSEEAAKKLHEILSESFWDKGLSLISRRGKAVLYMKGSERISDFLTFIGVPDAAIDYLNKQIYKDVRNKANRIANCDAANIGRAVDAGARQIADIEFLYATRGRETLDRVLRETADLRLENPDMTLAEIANSFDPPVTRSCINHRFRKMSDMAEQIRNELHSSSR